MRTLLRGLLALAFFAGLTRPAPGQALFPVRDSLSGEARDRTFHVLHYRIEVSFDEARKSVSGRTAITLVPFLPELRNVELDAEEMQISRVTHRGKPLAFSLHPKTLFIDLGRPWTRHDTLTLTVEYSCTPKKGLYFTQPDSGFPQKPWLIWTQGEDMDNHFWFPCYDFPNDRATSEVIGTVKSSYVLVSNGRLVRITENRALGTRTFHWSQDIPHASYLIMLAAGEYSVLHDKAGTVPLDYYVYPGQEDDARACFAETPAIMTFLAERIGVPYPWPKYAQVELTDFMYGGMENTSATTLLDESIILDARARLDESPAGLIAHEMAHQWWGDLITCKDWRHLWLNESFASYFDPLYLEASRGRDEFIYHLYGDQQAGINIDRALGRKPVVSQGTYTTNVYPRGSAILHMLRFTLGDSLFWRAINFYATTYRFQTVETNDFKRAIEEATGQNLYWFFDEWLYRAGHPVYDVSYTWSDTARTLQLAVRQTQVIDSLTGVFRMPVEVEVTTPSGVTTHRAAVWTKDTVLTLPCAEKPSMVLFDPGDWLLKELRFRKSREEWKEQALHASNPVERIRAVKELAAQPDSDDVVPVFGRLALHDPFYGVRRQAVICLGDLLSTGEEAKRETASVLLAASRDRHSGVRTAAVEYLGGLRGDSIVAAVRVALHDSSYGVVGSALGALSKADSAHAAAAIVQYLSVPSRRSAIASSALYALNRVDSTRAIEAAFRMVRYGEHPWTRHGAIQVLRGYSSIRSEFLALLSTLVKDKSPVIRSTAISYLGQYGDESFLPLLESIASDPAEDLAKTAKDAVEKLRSRAHKEEE
jgi:aminopeptidase N